MAQRPADPDQSVGPNAWLVDEMYDRFRADPASVSENWRDFFTAASPAPVAAPGAVPVAGAGNTGGVNKVRESRAGDAQAGANGVGDNGDGSNEPAPAEDAPPTPLRGAAGRVVANMRASLEVPTATSVRDVPARLLEVNRKILNNHLARGRGGKVSFTHLIAFAMVRALADVPVMNSSFVESVDERGTPGVVHHRHVAVGIAVDTTKPDGSRTLLVPCIRDADTMDFRTFWAAYEELVRKVRNNRITADDLTGATVSITNPGTLGTVHSVPRLMPGQGVILGVGAIEHPAEFQAADPRMLAELGVSKVVTLTSTYDHRIIQGAESGEFLGRMHALLLGEDGFYEGVFRSMAVPYEPVGWHADVNPVDRQRGRLEKQVHVQTLINMYRVRGHLIADLDPLAVKEPRMHPELDPVTYGLTLWDLDREFLTDGLAGREQMTLGDILGVLRDAYCRTIGVEYMHIQDPDQKRWIQQHVEGVPSELSPAEQRHVLGRLNAAEAFERFLHTKYVGQKRFGLEGGESAIPLLDALLDEAAKRGLSEAVMGMAHRGRLNVLANIIGKSYAELFREFEGDIDPDTVQGSGDVKYHKGAAGKFVGLSGVELPVTMASNPSHLEAVDPVVEGMSRARQDQTDDPASFPVLSVLVHGDAAFAGQGVVAETLNLSQLRGYRTGGTVHVVINNQLGFTTSPEAARSSVYPTDVAKMIQAPIFHVNGDDPEACARVARLAVGFRQAFHKDVVIDMVCYRRYGHNEGDEPSYTQPRMYEKIDQHRSVRKLYTETLVRRGDITMEEAEKALEDFGSRLQAALDETRSSAPPRPTALPPRTAHPKPLPPAATGVERAILDRVAAAVTAAPEGFTVHPKLARQLEVRAQLYAGGEVDWSMAEAMAVGSLLTEGYDVRLSGQDTRRGTFSQRHSVLVDYRTGAEHVPLASLSGQNGRQGRFFVYDSLLSEYAALGFEYGYSVVQKDALVVWEAQFGDFINGAQIVIDQFVVAAEDKWGQTSGLVLLLPHGYEGQGPEHSSARLERFLTLAAGGNICVVYPTTAAQYFHVLRAQVHRQAKVPLVVMTPKSLLRARQSRSPVEELSGGSFSVVLDDASVPDPQAVRRVILCSGKIAFEVMQRRDKADQGAGTAVVRVEQLYPWPEDQIAGILSRYPAASDVVWLQEEPENMGAWTFVHGRLHRLLRDDYSLTHVSRPESASPAVGVTAVHQLESDDLMRRALGLPAA
ncbi:MAG TPA: multifunctional oxoglutarate decarboxylase/oxoglutarate dehydrogenase thiamine pyrophosphate-binding subunit/dihydrolipoyllysine-residue succinyltransferase subunit [Acidimicrobiales bacterium]|nr:multifunctional oxoglutarate decarboxylase/oxoglutarate dehydrogenase thiamine pyrophosphate-binding subunit/dihydrolipoyllysine-residue succinyltransferase subunit [Acidimicrobiales bacterium]